MTHAERIYYLEQIAAAARDVVDATTAEDKSYWTRLQYLAHRLARLEDTIREYDRDKSVDDPLDAWEVR